MPNYNYTTKTATANHALTAWSFSANQPCTSTVLPDGCRDFIVSISAHGEQSWFISDLSLSAYSVASVKDKQLFGLRLKPGTQIDTSSLSRCLAQQSPNYMLTADRLDEFCSQSTALSDALDCLASGVPNINSAAQALGISSRTLQRLVKTQTGHSPHFWWSLARVRQAARSLPDFDSLAETAINSGYADQAHMTREMQKWFAASPKQIRENQELLSLLHESGYGSSPQTSPLSQQANKSPPGSRLDR